MHDNFSVGLLLPSKNIVHRLPGGVLHLSEGNPIVESKYVRYFYFFSLDQFLGRAHCGTEVYIHVKLDAPLLGEPQHILCDYGVDSLAN